MARRRSATPLLILALGPVLQACESSDSGAPLVTHHDSAGIRIIESYRPLWGDSSYWHIDPEPVLDLSESGTGDPHRFYSIRGMKRLFDGSIVVINGGSDEIRQFSADGRFVGSAGGSGEGPGEFSNIQQLALVGDTMLVLDWDGRITAFGPGPALIRTMRWHHGVESIHSLGNGTLVAELMSTIPEPAALGVFRPPLALLLFDHEGVQLDSIGQTAGGEEFTDNVSFSGTPLFPRRSHTVTHDGRIVHGASDLMQVEELAANGDFVRILRIPDYPLTLSDEQVEVERNARLNLPLPQGMTLPPQIRQAVESMPSPTTRPAYADMHVDPSGAVWLRPFRGVSESGEPVAWLVMHANGSWLGNVEVPTDFRIWDVGMDEILGTWTDELNAQHPRVLRLSRDGG